MSEDTKQLNIPIPAELHQELRVMAVRSGSSLRAYVAWVLQTSVDKKKAQERVQDALR